MSWKPVFKVRGEDDWCENAQRFATKEEALASAQARYRVWTMATACDTHPSDDPVNYRWDAIQGDVMINREKKHEAKRASDESTSDHAFIQSLQTGSVNACVSDDSSGSICGGDSGSSVGSD